MALKAVTASEDGTARLWDASSGTCLSVLRGHLKPVWCLAIYPSWEKVVTGSTDRTVRVWEAESGLCLRTLEGHASYVGGVAVLPGDRVVSASGDKTVKLWDVSEGRCTATLTGHTGDIRSVAVFPGGHLIATGSTDSSIKIWDTEQCSCVRTLAGHEGHVYSVVVFPGGKQLLSGSRDRTLRVWDAETGECLRKFTGHSNSIMGVAIFPSADKVVSCSQDQSVIVWDAVTGRQLQVLDHEDRVQAVTVSLDSTKVISAGSDHLPKVWDLQSGSCVQLEGHTNVVMGAAFFQERVVPPPPIIAKAVSSLSDVSAPGREASRSMSRRSVATTGPRKSVSVEAPLFAVGSEADEGTRIKALIHAINVEANLLEAQRPEAQQGLSHEEKDAAAKRYEELGEAARRLASCALKEVRRHAEETLKAQAMPGRRRSWEEKLAEGQARRRPSEAPRHLAWLVEGFGHDGVDGYYQLSDLARFALNGGRPVYRMAAEPPSFLFFVVEADRWLVGPDYTKLGGWVQSVGTELDKIAEWQRGEGGDDSWQVDGDITVIAAEEGLQPDMAAGSSPQSSAGRRKRALITGSVKRGS